MKIELIERMQKNDIEIGQNGSPSSREPPGEHTPCLQIKVPPEPIENRLQSRNWSRRKKDKIR